jgi:hypothetical protein
MVEWKRIACMTSRQVIIRALSNWIGHGASESSQEESDNGGVARSACMSGRSVLPRTFAG